MRYRNWAWVAVILTIAVSPLAAEVDANDDAESRASSVETYPPSPVVWHEESMVAGGAAAVRYLFVAGSNFRPRDSDTTFSYLGAGCMRRDSSAGDAWFTYDVDLPEGSVIDYLRLFYYDTNGASNVNAELWAFDGAGGTHFIADADGSGSPGYATVGSGFFAYPVDTLNQSFSVLASLGGGVGESLGLCGVRLRYQFVDSIFRDGFETGDTSAW